MSLSEIEFIEHEIVENHTHRYEAKNEGGRDVLRFLGKDEWGWISEDQMDRIYDWLTKLGHEVQIYCSDEYFKQFI